MKILGILLIIGGFWDTYNFSSAENVERRIIFIIAEFSIGALLLTLGWLKQRNEG
jgi:hypothetical protein